MNRLTRLLPSRISNQLNVGIGAAVFMTVAASIVGWFSFGQVGNAQERITEGAMPEIAAAFRVAQSSGTLVAAGPGLAASDTDEEFKTVSRSIDQARMTFEEQLTSLEKSYGIDTGNSMTAMSSPMPP